MLTVLSLGVTLHGMRSCVSGAKGEGLLSFMEFRKQAGDATSRINLAGQGTLVSRLKTDTTGTTGVINV